MFAMTWGWVNNDKMTILEGTTPLSFTKYQLQTKVCYYNSPHTHKTDHFRTREHKMWECKAIIKKKNTMTWIQPEYHYPVMCTLWAVKWRQKGQKKERKQALHLWQWVQQSWRRQSLWRTAWHSGIGPALASGRPPVERTLRSGCGPSAWQNHLRTLLHCAARKEEKHEKGYSLLTKHMLPSTYINTEWAMHFFWDKAICH